MLKPPRGSPAVAAAHVGDSAEGERVSCFDDRFPELLAATGRQFVDSMRRGTVVEAARAWLQVFVGRYQPLAGADGAEWLATRELTFKLFVQTLYAVQGGKSVGPSGFSVDLLRACGRGGEVQRAVYDAIMADFKEARIPASWRNVVYALLVKPPPNNPDIIGERREIALMEQLMKVVTRAARSATYGRMEGRVLAPQLGWLQGCATAHVGLQLQVAMQQAARVGHPLYVLYVDLATFFPSIDRGVLLEHELFAGVPRDVLNLAAAIFGAAEAEYGDGAVCRYDSAAGLGKAFINNMGALMGCVLSPAKAKLFMNSVVAAIHLSVRGTRLWGCAPRTQGEAWTRLGQLAFADDWAGAFARLEELRLAWALFSAWTVVMGQQLGVKKKLKTVATAVAYAEGRPVKVEDPKLQMPDGSYVPFLAHTEVYKHLGIWLRADAVDGAVFTRAKAKVAFAMGRLRRLRGASQREFCTIADVLMRGIVGFYFQTVHLTWREAEALETIFRAAFNRYFGRAASSARMPLYAGRHGSKPLRTHAWSVAVAALYTVVAEAMSEAVDSPQRVAARSAVAAAMARWGCRCAPEEWDWSHLRGPLEQELARGGVRHLGDAWMLAALLAAEEDDRRALEEARGGEDGDSGGGGGGGDGGCGRM